MTVIRRRRVVEFVADSPAIPLPSYGPPQRPSKPLTEAQLRREALPTAGRAKAEALVERSRLMSKMTADQRRAFRMAEKQAQQRERARRAFDRKTLSRPEVAARFDPADLLTEDEIDLLLGESPEARRTWITGTISDFIRTLARYTTLQRADMDRLVFARNRRTGVEDPPWLIHYMVRTRTSGWSLLRWKMRHGVSYDEAHEWARLRLPGLRPRKQP